MKRERFSGMALTVVGLILEMMKSYLESSGLFTVEIARTAKKGTDPNFAPKFKDFDVVNLRDDDQEQTELSAKYPEKFAQLKQALIEHDREVMVEGPDWWKDEIDRQP